jgi:hypothetical protein
MKNLTRFPALILGLLLCPSLAFAINRCTLPNGNITFQDAPCQFGKTTAIESAPSAPLSRPVQATAPQPAAPAPTLKSAAPTEAVPKVAAVVAKPTLNEQVESAKDERVRREKWFTMTNLRNTLNNTRAGCEHDQTSLRAARNGSGTLAGEVHNASLMSELAAAAVACDGRMRMQERHVADAERTCVEIKCIAPGK